MQIVAQTHEHLVSQLQEESKLIPGFESTQPDDFLKAWMNFSSAKKDCVVRHKPIGC